MRLNERPFRKREGSRASLFRSLEKPALSPLPAERFDMSQWSRATVNIDYHIAFDTNFYSVPYKLVQQVVEVRSTPTTVEIFHQGKRVASHARSREHGTSHHQPRAPSQEPSSASGVAALAHGELGAHHRPAHSASCSNASSTRSRTRRWAIVLVWASFAWRNSTRPQRMEAAAERAILAQACRYQSVKSILKNSLDAVPLSPPRSGSSAPTHDNIRGAEYFAQGGPRSC